MLLTRRAEFSASHVCRIPSLDEASNKRLFGEAANPNGHGHNYIVEVTVEGEPNPVTGMVIDLKELKEIIDEEVLVPMDHRFLNHEVPPFDRIDAASYRDAFLAGMRAQREEISAIAGCREAASCENTLVALERSGRLLERVSTVFYNLAQSDGSDAMLALDSELAPRLAAHRDAIYLDTQLFARVDALKARADSLPLTAEERQLLERYHVAFVRAGARLADTHKLRLSAINERLAALRTRFRQNVLQATREGGVWI